MLSERLTLGFDRQIDIAWLDAVAGQVASGRSVKETREFIWNLLEGVLSGEGSRSARDKTRTVLARVWMTPPEEAVALRDAALGLLGVVSHQERLAIHWAMLFAVYPFFADVTGNIGKLLQLNGEVALAQLNRRLVEGWGDRSTLRQATRKVVRSLIQWDALQDGGKAGLYLAPKEKIVVSSKVAPLLIEGLLIATRKGMPLIQLVSHPAMFPFSVKVDISALRENLRLQIHRQGDQTDFVEMSSRSDSKNLVRSQLRQKESGKKDAHGQDGEEPQLRLLT